MTVARAGEGFVKGNVRDRAGLARCRVRRRLRGESALPWLGRPGRVLAVLGILLLATSCSTNQAARTSPQSSVSMPLHPTAKALETDGSFLLLPPPVASEPASSSTVEEPNPLPVSPGFATLLKKDAQYIANAPLHWGRSDWTKFGIGMLAVGGVLLLDDELRQSLEPNSNGTTRGIADAVEPFGGEYSWGVLGAFYLTGRLLKNEKASAVAEDGLTSSLIAAGVITPILKATLGRRRPSQTYGTYDWGQGGSSFPSGHTTQAFAIASVIASHYDSPWVQVAAYGLAGLVGWSRMEHDAHYASDVLAGALIGAVVGRTVVRLHKSERLSLALAPTVNPRSPGVALALRTNLRDVIGVFRSD